MEGETNITTIEYVRISGVKEIKHRKNRKCVSAWVGFTTSGYTSLQMQH